MHARTKRLHEIMQQNNLSPADVAGKLNRKTQTVLIWRVEGTERVIPENELRLLEHLVAFNQQSV